jgi:hypothetical protein
MEQISPVLKELQLAQASKILPTLLLGVPQRVSLHDLQMI